jgi:hypothetical protein
MAVFEAIFRVFLITELELLRSHSTSPKAIFLVVLGVLFAFYAAVQAAAAYDRKALVFQAQHEVHMVLQTELALIVLDVLFSIASLVYLIVATISNEGVNPRRTALIGTSLIGIVIAILISDVFCVLTGTKMYSNMPSLLTSSASVTFAAITIFLLHTGGGRGYDSIQEEEKVPAATMEIEPRSDDDDGDDDEEEDTEK